MLESETERRGGVSEGARKKESPDSREGESRGRGREQEEDCGWYIWERSTFAQLQFCVDLVTGDI